MFKVLLILFSLFLVTPSYAQSQVQPCTTMEYDKFIARVKPTLAKYKKIPDEIAQRYISHINKVRSEFRKEPLIGNLLVGGVMKNGDFGLALFNNGCGVREGVWFWTKKEDVRGYFERQKFMDIYNLFQDEV